MNIHKVIDRLLDKSDYLSNEDFLEYEELELIKERNEVKYNDN